MKDCKHIVSRFVEELWNERNLEVADTIFDEDCHTHQLRSGPPAVAAPRGPAAIKPTSPIGCPGFPISRSQWSRYSPTEIE
jgi:hypothetical protein